MLPKVAATPSLLFHSSSTLAPAHQPPKGKRNPPSYALNLHKHETLLSKPPCHCLFEQVKQCRYLGHSRLLPDVLVAPNPCLVITASSSKVVSSRAWRDRNDRILVTLEHHLRVSSIWVPELHASILRTAHHPFSARSEANAENIVLYTLAWCHRRDMVKERTL